MLIEYSSPYLSNLNLQEADAQQATACIRAASQWVSTFCNRTFEQQEFDEVVTVAQDSSVSLPNPPIAYISRVLTATGSWLKLQNLAATSASYGTSALGLNLVSLTGGVRTNTLLTWQAYPSLTLLAAAVGALDGWTASATSGFGDQASSDLIASQAGACRLSPVVLCSWQDDARQISFEPGTGIIEGPGGMNWLEPFPLVWSTAGTAGFFGFYGFARLQQIRVIYTAGYSPDQMPEDLKSVVANLVISAFQSPEGRAQSMTIGGQYSYSIMDYDKLAISDRKVLSFYRDRRI